MQEYSIIYQTALSILSAIITGGFVLIYVELSNKKTRESDNYEQLMRPFMHKLTAYFCFVSWCKCKIRIPKDGQKGGESDFKQILDDLARYGGRAIVSGGDYLVNKFMANELYDICYNKINQVWYLTDHVHSCNLQWDDTNHWDDEFIRKELQEINPHYKELDISLDTFIKVSSEFHTEIYQLVEVDTFIHESSMRLMKYHTIFVTGSFLFVLLLLCSMLIFEIPGFIIQGATILVLILLLICMLMVGISYSTQIKWYNAFNRKRENVNKMKRYFTYRILEPVGLFLLLGSFCWQTISNEYRDQQQQSYQSNIDSVIVATADLVASTAFRDTTNYKGQTITNYNPDAILSATSKIYSEQDKIINLYGQYRYYHWIQVILYIIGSFLIILCKTEQSIRKE